MIRIGGHDVPDPMKIFRAYARQHPKTLREYDLADMGDSNILTVPEAWRTRFIGSRITRAECDKLADLAASAPWTTVPAAADLINADPAVSNGVFERAARMYWHFTGPARPWGIRVAKIHKALHAKRPALYPILDRRLKRLYRKSAARWIRPLAHLGNLTLDDSPPYWAAIRDDLISCQADLAQCRQVLANDPDETVRNLAKLTDVRLLDILGWAISKRVPPWRAR